MCKAIIDVLSLQYIRFPSGNELLRTVSAFEAVHGVPQCVGAIDGSHIPINAPNRNHTNYYNRKGFYSVILQAVVDHRYCFTDINVGWPGCVHDARVFANSSIYEKASDGIILPSDIVQTIGETTIPLYIIGDSAYPLLSWLMKPFPNGTQDQEKKTYNYRMSSARIVVENAFGRLKGRWRRLMKKNEMRIDNVIMVVGACCVLHNICEVHGDAFNDSWLTHSQEDLQSTSMDQGDTGSHQGSEIRNALVRYFSP